jgi:hypothetical protein
MPLILAHFPIPEPGIAAALQHAMRRALIIVGLVLIAAGLLWPWLSKLGLGRLPGDIRIETGSGGFYFPVVTCLVISILLSLLLWLFRR